MTTPIMKVNTVAPTVVAGTPNAIFFPTQDPTGAPIDVHTGYTVGAFWTQPATDNNVVNDAVDLSGTGSFTFSTTGVTWNLTTAQSPLQTPTLHTAYSLSLSNDAGTTHSICAVGTLTLQLTPSVDT